ncbi:hypothetical protein Ahy_A10g047273 [Arachis hypogaea]|uniref:Ubiquitin-like protease family profile domain-containing protein n=1 Tax=Arachis hypogaea TaxID=3818 RepID=A0A445B237_ARAHY|nr:hypothetical protein Ahy_A10g047273 [Arachis hypogaea]
MTLVKQTKDSSNEYDAIFVLEHDALYEGVREHFMSLMPKEQVESTMFILENHGVEYTNKRTNKAYRFDIEQYAHQHRFLDKEKLASHPFGLIISQMRVYVGADPLIEDGEGKEVEYIILNGQCTNYDCGIYIMKWLETIDPQKIKSGKRYKYKAWTQEEIDDFRYQYCLNILLHEMNKIRD